MFTGPVGPVEVFFYWPETVFGNFYWPGAIGSPLASSPVDIIMLVMMMMVMINVYREHGLITYPMSKAY